MKRATTLVIMFLSLFLFTTVNATQENIIFSYHTRINQEKLIITEWLNSLNLKHSNNKQNTKIIDLVYETAEDFGISPLLILSIIKHESTFNKKAKSPYGAKGLMQVVDRLHKEKIKGRNIYDPAVSIQVGTRILSDCLNNKKGNVYKALHCYSGGASYSGKIKATHDNLKRQIIVKQFINQQQIVADYKFSKPFSTAFFSTQQFMIASSF